MQRVRFGHYFRLVLVVQMNENIFLLDTYLQTIGRRRCLRDAHLGPRFAAWGYWVLSICLTGCGCLRLSRLTHC